MDYVKLPKADAIRKAEEALKVFWSVSAAEYPENMHLSWSEFLAWMHKRSDEWFVDFGNTIHNQAGVFGLGSGSAHQAMEDLARSSEGKVAQFEDGHPRGTDFYDAILGQLGNWTVSRIWSATKETAKESAKAGISAASLALGGYVGIMVAASVVGLLVVILSYRKRP